MKAFFQVRARAASTIASYFLLPDGCPMPLFRIGQRVIWEDIYSDKYFHRVVGIICGFEYLDHPEFNSGWSYILKPEVSVIVYGDGATRTLDNGRIETAPEQELKLITQPARIARLIK